MAERMYLEGQITRQCGICRIEKVKKAEFLQEDELKTLCEYVSCLGGDVSLSFDHYHVCCAGQGDIGRRV